MNSPKSLSATRPLSESLGTLPWMWLWACYQIPKTIVGFPFLVAALYSSRLGSVGFKTQESIPIMLTELITEVFPTLGLFLGVGFLLCAGVRAKRLEAQHNLTIPDGSNSTTNEIIAWVKEQAPGVGVRVNLRRVSALGFAYAWGPRRPALAIFGGLVRLWYSDREAAQAVLGHELAHLRRGDGLVLGVADAVNTSLAAAAVLAERLKFHFVMTLGFGIFYLIFLPKASLEEGTYGFVLLLVLPALINLPFSLLPLIACIWLAELNADRLAATSFSTTLGLLRALNGVQPNASWLQIWKERLTHPPIKLRLWAAGASETAWIVLTLVLIFALSIGPIWFETARTLFRPLIGWNYYLRSISGTSLVGWRTYLGVTTQHSLLQELPLFFIVGILMVLWPWLAPVWEVAFGAGSAQYPPVVRRKILPWGSALLVMGTTLLLSRANHDKWWSQEIEQDPVRLQHAWSLTTQPNWTLRFSSDKSWHLHGSFQPPPDPLASAILRTEVVPPVQPIDFNGTYSIDTPNSVTFKGMFPFVSGGGVIEDNGKVNAEKAFAVEQNWATDAPEKPLELSYFCYLRENNLYLKTATGPPTQWQLKKETAPSSTH